MAFNPQEHMLNLKGKDYLQVMWRLVWFREDHPEWGIETYLTEHDAEIGSAVCKCTIVDPATGRIVSSGYGSETKKDFGDYLEKAETKAVGRALAMLGYGTQFAPELDEGERIVDSPVARAEKPKKNVTVKRLDTPVVCHRCGIEIADKTIGGKVFTKNQIIEESKKRFGDDTVMCCDCMRTLKKLNDERSA